METVEITEKSLSDVFGGLVKLDDGDDLGGSNGTKVYRFAILAGPSDAPSSVLVKQARSVGGVVYNPDVPEIPAWTLLNEWAGLQLLNQITGCASFSPRFYAGDRTTGLIVMEDLGSGEFGHLEAIGATVRVIAAKLRTLWHESDTIPYYPSFR